MSQGKCSMHRQPTKTQSNKGISYAMKSLPPACKLCPSSAAGEGYGVYTNQDIPKGTWIGPYEGRRIRPCDVTPSMDTSHMWEVRYKVYCFKTSSVAWYGLVACPEWAQSGTNTFSMPSTSCKHSRSLLPRITPLHVIITIFCYHFHYLKLL